MDKPDVINVGHIGLEESILFLTLKDAKTKADIARAIGVKPQAFRMALRNNSLRVRELIEIADMQGYDVVLRKKDDD